jgi:hypothetical protein
LTTLNWNLVKTKKRIGFSPELGEVSSFIKEAQRSRKMRPKTSLRKGCRKKPLGKLNRIIKMSLATNIIKLHLKFIHRILKKNWTQIKGLRVKSHPMQI